VIEALGDRVQDLDSTDPDMQAGLARLRRDCVEAKEALSSDTHTVVPVALGGWSTSVRLTRSELEDLIRAPLEETVAAVGRAIRSAGLQPADLSAIVLVGGGSRIPLVREMLQQQFPVATALDTHPKHDVALGAVQVGMRGAGPASGGVSAESVSAASTAASTFETAQLTSPVTEPIPAVDPYADPMAITQVVSSAHPERTRNRRPQQAPPPSEPEPEQQQQPPPPPPREPSIPPQLRPVTSRPTEIGGLADLGLGGGGGSGGGLSWRRLALLVGGALAAVLVVVGGIFALTSGNNDKSPSPTTSTTAPTAVAATTPTLPAALTVPVSDPLPATKLMLGMETGDGTTQIYSGTVGASGQQGYTLLTSGPGTNTAPSLSPDRRSVIYVHVDGDNRRTLKVMAVDGTGQRDLFAEVPAFCNSFFRPGWNPKDPTQIAVACNDSDGLSSLYLMTIDGRVTRKMPIRWAGRVDDAAFSPDGKTIAYFQSSSTTQGDGGAIFTIGVTDAAPKNISNGRPGWDADPAFSLDGTKIAFRRRVSDGTSSGNFDIFVTPVDGSGTAKVLIKGSKSDDQDPTWSPDGTHLAFKSNRATPSGDVSVGPARVWIVKADGSDPRPISTGSTPSQTAPAWIRR
jgi:Tol biopolymer transport system component